MFTDHSSPDLLFAPCLARLRAEAESKVYGPLKTREYNLRAYGRSGMWLDLRRRDRFDRRAFGDGWHQSRVSTFKGGTELTIPYADTAIRSDIRASEQAEPRYRGQAAWLGGKTQTPSSSTTLPSRTPELKPDEREQVIQRPAPDQPPARIFSPPGTGPQSWHA